MWGLSLRIPTHCRVRKVKKLRSSDELLGVAVRPRISGQDDAKPRSGVLRWSPDLRPSPSPAPRARNKKAQSFRTGKVRRNIPSSPGDDTLPEDFSPTPPAGRVGAFRANCDNFSTYPDTPVPHRGTTEKRWVPHLAFFGRLGLFVLTAECPIQAARSRPLEWVFSSQQSTRNSPSDAFAPPKHLP